MKRKIKFWKWDESFNYTSFKLGKEIFSFKEKGLIKKNKYNPDKYKVASGFPESLKVFNNKIISIRFEKEFLNFDGENLWELKDLDFIEAMNQYLEPCDYKFKGDTLMVLFLDIFTDYAEIKRANIE